VKKKLRKLLALLLVKALILVARMLGAVFLGIGFICWFTSQVSDTSLGRDIVLALFLADTVGFLVTLLAQLSPIAAASGWVGVAIWLLLAAGLGYFRFVR